MVHAVFADEYPATVGALCTGAGGQAVLQAYTKFRKDPIRQGLGLQNAAHTGERPCPRCVNKLGASSREVMAEFCMMDT